MSGGESCLDTGGASCLTDGEVSGGESCLETAARAVLIPTAKCRAAKAASRRAARAALIAPPVLVGKGAGLSYAPRPDSERK